MLGRACISAASQPCRAKLSSSSLRLRTTLSRCQQLGSSLSLLQHHPSSSLSSRALHVHLQDYLPAASKLHPAPAAGGSTGSSPASRKKPLVFLHGLLGSGVNFRSILLNDRFKDYWPITIDLRNHGKSEHHPDMSFDAMAEDVRSALAAHGIERDVTLVGHSLGGKVSCALALKHRQLLRQLIVMDISPVAYDPEKALWGTVANVIRAGSLLKPEQFSSRAEIDRELSKTIPDFGMRSFLGQNLVVQGDGSYRWRVDFEILMSNMPKLAQFYTPPPEGPFPAVTSSDLPGGVHFIRGSKSGYVREKHFPTIYAFFPEAHIHTLQDAGHWLHADKPQEFVQMLGGILEGRGV